MATTYTSILKLALPTQGELSGTWGDVINDNITSMIEEAIAGRAVINGTWSGDSMTLSTANGTTSQSRCAMLEFTDTGGALSGNATAICPTATKIYIITNNVGSSRTLTLKTSGGTGVAVPDGKTMILFCDGTNVVEALTNVSSLSIGGYALTLANTLTTSGAYPLTLTTTASTNVTLPTTGTLATLTGSETLTSKVLTSPDINGGTIDGVTIGATSAPTVTNLGTVTTCDINGGTIDGVTIGATSAPTVTNLGTVTTCDINGGTIDGVTIGATSAPTVTNLGTVTTCDINGGTIDGVTIGGSSAGTGKFTTATIAGGGGFGGDIIFGSTTNTYIRGYSSIDTVYIYTGGTERVRISSSGAVQIGHSGVGYSTKLSVDNGDLFVDGAIFTGEVGSSNFPSMVINAATGNDDPAITITSYHSGSLETDIPSVVLCRSKGTTYASATAVTSGDELGQILFRGADGTDILTLGASIVCEVDGTVAANQVPSALRFSTANSGGTLTERMTINAAGDVYPTTGTTGMTSGFFYIPAAAGIPSGTPTGVSGRVPMYYDTTNNDFYVYNGAWKKVALA